MLFLTLGTLMFIQVMLKRKASRERETSVPTIKHYGPITKTTFHVM